MIDRRAFLKMNTALVAAQALNAAPEWLAPTSPGADAAPSPGATGGKRPLASVQIGPESLLEEGVEACLDFLQEEAAVDSLFCYSQTYHLIQPPAHILATDHPSPRRGRPEGELPWQWMRLPEAAFSDLAVKHANPPGAAYAKEDVFATLAEACSRRGMKLYARFLEASMRRADRIPGYQSVAVVDSAGRPGEGPCWNHPDYREWIRRTVEQMMKAYPLDGLQYGAERVGALSDVLFKGQKATCFCSHCQRRIEGAGINFRRAREGYQLLEGLMERVAAVGAGGAREPDGVGVAVLRVLFRYPEVLPFYAEWLRADNEIQAMVYHTAKAVRPTADVGQHVDHQRSSWDLFYRAIMPYSDLAAHNDFIKPIVYHEILAVRMREWVVDAMQGRVFADLGREQTLGLLYSLLGYDPNAEPSYAELAARGMSAEYVYRETARCVAGVGGRAKVYAGIGLDVPHYVPTGMVTRISKPEEVYAGTIRALDAGADGVMASREYAEMTRASLGAFGRAVREWRPPGGGTGVSGRGVDRGGWD
jgi:hypothetical protein